MGIGIGDTLSVTASLRENAQPNPRVFQEASCWLVPLGVFSTGGLRGGNFSP